MHRLSITLVAAAALVAAAPLSAQQTDIIRGRVTGPDTSSVEGVIVRATSYSGGVTKSARTDRNGRFTILFVNGEGDYWLDFAKIGFAPRRFEIKRIGEEEVLIADTKMTSTIATLDAANIIGQPNRALPNRAANPDVGGGERPLTNAQVAVDQAGNLAAMAAGIPGIQLIPGLDGAADMFSFLGLSGDQNNTTFNGLGSGISTLPPDILATTSIRPYTFDAAIGGFSGAQVSIQTFPGSNFSRRAMNNVDIAPQTELADATADAQGQRYTSARLGGNAAGPVTMDKLFYNGAYNVSRRFNDVQSLLNTSPLGLAAAGVAADSVTRLLDILRTLHVPATVASVPRQQVQDAVQGALNLDIVPSSSGTGHSLTLGLAGNWQRAQPATGRGSLLLTTPGHNGENGFWGANVALTHMNYFWFGILSKTTLGYAESGTSTEPFLRLPQGTVLVNSSLPDGSSSVQSLSFGGSQAVSRSGNEALQLANQMSWYSEDNRHVLRLTSSVTRDEFTSDVSPNLRGSFAFNSLGDLAAGRASSFTRTLSRLQQSGSQLTGALSFGDYWRPKPELQVQYGLRADANRFLSAPEFNRALLDTFGLRNDAVPNHVYLSPRLGVQWYYGSAPTVAFAPGAARPPRAVIHAGIGIFQNVAGARLITSAVNATGLPSSTQSISCVGAAVPFPDWNAFLDDERSIPSRCADGTAGTVFASSAPSATLFDPGYLQPRSLRTAADWSSPIVDNRFVLGVQGILSWGIAQQGAVDVNLVRTPRFSLSAEGDRPVFASASAIVPSTGATAIRDSRVAPSFQRVTLERSNLRVNSRQLTVNLKPVTASAFLKWDLAYTFQDSREEFSGFTSTSGNPFTSQWGRALQAGRHAFTLTWTDFPIFDVVYVTTQLRVMSRQPYTPMVAGDVNGDGYNNDRAFIFDPARSADTAVASAMRSLLTTGDASARACLRRQIGALAARGSCDAPWVALAGLQVKFNPQKIGLPKRLNITFTVQNPLGIADLALHGSNDLRGWGQVIPPDQSLLFVRGFDPATQRFKYDVNQRFGSTRPTQTATRVLPFISLGVGMDIGVPRERQLLTQRMDLGRGRPGNVQPAEALKILGTSSIPNPMSMILGQEDSLHLTRKQADSLATLSRKFSVFADSVWTPVANQLQALPKEYSRGAAYDRYVSARERTVDYLLTLVPSAKNVLTSSQRRKLPMQISNYLDERVLKFLRSSSSGDGSPLIIR